MKHFYTILIIATWLLCMAVGIIIARAISTSKWDIDGTTIHTEKVPVSGHFYSKIQSINTGNDWHNALEVLSLTTAQVGKYGAPGVKGNMQQLYDGIEAGNPTLCGDISILLSSAYYMAGTDNYIYQLTAENGTDTHVTVDVYIKEYDKWVNIDPTFSGYYTYKGIPQSVPELHQLFIDGKTDKVTFHPIGGKVSMRPWNYQINPLTTYYKIEKQRAQFPSPDLKR